MGARFLVPRAARFHFRSGAAHVISFRDAATAGGAAMRSGRAPKGQWRASPSLSLAVLCLTKCDIFCARRTVACACSRGAPAGIALSPPTGRAMNAARTLNLPVAAARRLRSRLADVEQERRYGDTCNNRDLQHVSSKIGGRIERGSYARLIRIVFCQTACWLMEKIAKSGLTEKPARPSAMAPRGLSYSSFRADRRSSVRFGSWSCKNILPKEVGEKPGPGRSQATIAAISGLVPTMFMTRVRL
jgi:hypothetical protein